MSKPLPENELRMLLRAVADQADATATRPDRAVRHAKRRLTRNAVAMVLSLSVIAYGAIAIASRITPGPVPVTGERGEAQDSEIWIMDATGANQKRVTAGSGVDEDPAWSPDGKKIAFVSNRAGNSDIWVLDLTTGKARQLTFDHARESAPKWTPDGKTIAFLRFQGTKAPMLYTVATDGTAPRATRYTAVSAFTFSANGTEIFYSCLAPISLPAGASNHTFSRICRDPAPRVGPSSNTRIFESPGAVSGLALSPDGTRLVFSFRYPVPSDNVDAQASAADLGIVNIDGSQFMRLGNDPPRDEDPVWSSNGTILYGRDGDIWTTLPDASNEARITFDPTADDRQPAVSRDGSRIAFARVMDPPTQIYSMDAEGGSMFRLTDIPGVNGGAAVSHDGKKIAFTSARDGFAAIYVIDFNEDEDYRRGADESTLKRLTDDRDGSFRPVWSPDGRIAYISESAVWIMNADGSNKVKLPAPEGVASWPSWSLDGSLIAFQHEADVYVIRPDGAGLRKIASNASSPAFGGGLLLAFVTEVDGGPAIKIVDLSPGGAAPRVHRSNRFNNPVALYWLGDSEILFRNGRGIAAMSWDSGAIRSITHGPANDYNPSWAPDGRILFNSDR